MSVLWQTCKVFVSSTFKDLELARDRLAQIFRDIEKNMLKSHVTIMPYDLRWRDRHSTEPITQWCVKMVKECSYFIGILASRYGWRPPEDGQGQINIRKMSVTEMEVREALQRVRPENRFFCFAHTSAQDSSETSEDLTSLQALKNELQERGEKIFIYQNIQELLDIIRREFQARLDAEFPPGQPALPLTYTYQDALREIVSEKKRGFIGRTTYLKQLTQFAQSTEGNNYLIIQAVAGTGKSSLLAEFIHLVQAQNFAPTQGPMQTLSNIPIIAHFLSMGGDSREVNGIFRSLAEQLAGLNFFHTALPTAPDELQSLVQTTLEQTQQHLVLVLDGLDEVNEAGQNLLWLPKFLPSQVRVIITTRPVETWEILQKFPKIQSLELPKMESGEINTIIAMYVTAKKLALSQADQELLQTNAAGNPLFLKVALDEITASGIAVGQLKTSVEGLFDQILDRLTAKYDQQFQASGIDLKASELLSQYLGLIAAGRAGIPECELREILQLHNSRFLGDDILFSMTKALQNFIITRKNLLAFFHPEFERRIKILQGKSGMRTHHRTLAAYLQSKGISYTRTLDELPYQLQWGEEYEQLAQQLSSLSFLTAKAEAGMIYSLKEDFDLAIHSIVVKLPDNLRIQQNDIPVTKEMIRLLGRAIELELQFLERHPECLFQTLWNYGYWHDCPEASQYYQIFPGEKPPWQTSGDKLYRLVEFWRSQIPSDKIWLKTSRPLPQRIDSALIKVFRGHKDYVYSIAYSPDGRLIASGSRDNTVNIWDIQTTQLIHSLQGHEKPVNSVAYSPDGRFVVSGSNDQTVRIWAAQTAKLIHVLHGHEHAVMSVAYSPDGRFVASGSDDKTIRIWDVQSGNLIQTLIGHKHWVNSVAYSPDGKFLVSGSRDKTVHIWDLQTGTIRHILRGHKHWVVSVACSPDGQFLASGSWDNTVRIWSLQTGDLIHSLAQHKSCVTSVAYSADGKFLASGSRDEILCLWDTQTGQLVRSLLGHEDYVTSIAYSLDGRYLGSGSEDNTIRLWSAKISNQGYADYVIGFIPIHQQPQANNSHLENPQTPASLLENPQANNSLLENSQTPASLLENPQANNSHLENPQTPASLLENPQTVVPTTDKQQRHAHWITLMAYSTDGRFITYGSKDKMVWVLDAVTGNLIHLLQGHRKECNSIVYSPDNNFLATGSDDGMICLWNLHSGKLIYSFTIHENAITSMAYSLDGKFLASGSEDKTIQIWDTTNGSLVHSFLGHDGAITSLAYSLDGKFLASGSEDKTVKIWDTTNGRIARSLPAQYSGVTSIAYSPDGRFLAEGLQDSTIHIWDIFVGIVVHSLIGHEKAIANIMYSPDGQSLFSQSQDQTIRIWSADTAVCLHTLPGQADIQNILQKLPYYALSQMVETAIFSQDGQAIAFFYTPMKQTCLSQAKILTGFAYSYFASLQLCGAR